MENDLRTRIQDQINCCSAENGSNTPDFILAAYLVNCLHAFDVAVNARESWHGRQADPVDLARGRG